MSRRARSGAIDVTEKIKIRELNGNGSSLEEIAKIIEQEIVVPEAPSTAIPTPSVVKGSRLTQLKNEDVVSKKR